MCVLFRKEFHFSRIRHLESAQLLSRNWDKRRQGEKARECLQPACSANRETSCLPGFHRTFWHAYIRLNFHIHELQERKTLQTLCKYLKWRFLLLQKILEASSVRVWFSISWAVHENQLLLPWLSLWPHPSFIRCETRRLWVRQGWERQPCCCCCWSGWLQG